MAIVNPFKAVRATRDKVALVSSKNLDHYNKNELEVELKYNPFSFLHIILPEKSSKNLNQEEKFEEVKKRYQLFKKEHTYIQDKKPFYYLYKKTIKNNTFLGIVAATSTNDYKNNVIKKHEKTLKSREILFKKYLKSTGFNAEPVLLTYPDNANIDKVLNNYQTTRPEYEFTTTNYKTHQVWIIDNEKDIAIIQQEFAKQDALYIADGHHRSASSFLLSEDLATKNKNHQGDEPYNFCLSYLIPESNLQIIEFNRLIKDLNGLSEKDFLKQVEKYYKITKLEENTFKKSNFHSFTMYLNKDTYFIELKGNTCKFKTPRHKLDTHLLHKTILKPILGIKSVRKSKKITYASGLKGDVYLKEKVQQGKFKIGFSLHPIPIKQLKDIADEGFTMPPKSTYILPKLRSGLFIYEF